MKEFIRKKLVYLKRHPQVIPFIFCVINCIIYTFSMSDYSKSVLYVGEEKGLAFQMFIITLSSFITILLFFGALKKLTKTSVYTIVFCCILAILQIILAINYVQKMNYHFYLIETPIPMRDFITKSISVSKTFIITLALFLLSCVLLPVYSKAFKKINTTSASELLLRKSVQGEDKETIDFVEEI